MYVIHIRTAVAVLQATTVALLIFAIVQEFATEEEVSKPIVVPTLFVAAFTGSLGSAMVFRDMQIMRRLR